MRGLQSKGGLHDVGASVVNDLLWTIVQIEQQHHTVSVNGKRTEGSIKELIEERRQGPFWDLKRQHLLSCQPAREPLKD